MSAELVGGQPRLSVVIPIYNAVGQIEPLLNQLLELRAGAGSSNLQAGQEPASEMEIILADDASPDGSAAHFAATYPDITVVTAAANGGFGVNCMRGVSAACGDYIALVNSDVDLVGDPFTPLLTALEADGSIFASMPLIFNTHLGMVENLARLYCHRGLCWHTELAEQAEWTARARELIEARRDAAVYIGTSPIEAVLCGAMFVCRRDRFLELGGFDPRYRPYYWEDVALGYSALERGWRNVTVPGALILHRHSETINKAVGTRKLRYLLINQLRFVQHHRAQLRAAGLRHERMWWLARAFRKALQFDGSLAAAYSSAAVVPIQGP